MIGASRSGRVVTTISCSGGPAAIVSRYSALRRAGGPGVVTRSAIVGPCFAAQATVMA